MIVVWIVELSLPIFDTLIFPQYFFTYYRLYPFSKSLTLSHTFHRQSPKPKLSTNSSIRPMYVETANNISSSDSEDDKSQNESLSDEWPPHACSYCGLRNKNCVIKCSNKACGKWFCNEKGQNGFASHIIFHLVKSKHNEISTHPEGEFGDLAIECFVCGNTNVFVLGYVNVKDGNDQTVIFICRAPCVTDQKSNEYEWNPEEWKPLIQQKELVDWVAQKCQENDKRIEFPIQEMIKLQEAWKTNPKLRYNDISKKKVVRRLKPIYLKYRSGKQYKNVFEALLVEQSKTDKKIKESQTQNNMRISFSHINGKRFAYFMFSSREDIDASLLPGNQLKISYKNQWSSKGVVIKIMGNQEVCLELFTHQTPPKEEYPYKVEFVWKPTSYHRMKKGLRVFLNDHTSISSYLYHTILGQPWQKNSLDIKIPQKIQVPGLPKPNYYQEEAVRRALRQPLCLIQGPPGTGKTVTSASIVFHLVKATKKRILVCAPSNVVVDMLAQRISQTGIKVVRFCSKSRESVSSDVEELTLHYKLKRIKHPDFAKLKQYFTKEEQEKEFTLDQEVKFKKLKKSAEKLILSQADVVCATCIASADKRLSDLTFNHVLIDEATQAVEPECLLPMLKSAKQVILVGDHLQLGPVVICRQAAKAGLNKCLFQRLVLIGHKPIRLQVQYRMHPHLSYFPSNTFYDGTLQNGITERDRQLNTSFPWPQQKPSFFLNTYGLQQLSASGTSYLNRTQAAAVDKILFYLERAGVKAPQIGIITPYKGQRAYIINFLQKNGQIGSKNPNYYKEIEIASVDGYQGRQKDFIIVSCVRSNQGPGIGFLKDPRRLNVTITRAKYGMIVVGNAKVLYQDNLWNNLLNFYKSNETLVEGTIPNFRPTLLNFPPPLKYTAERKQDEKDQNEEEKGGYKIQNSNFNFLDQIPITSGVRYSALGYTDIPEVAAFTKDPLFEIFSSKKGKGFSEGLNPRMNFEDI